MMKTMELNDMETKENKICEEMLKLRDWLNENGIGWEDVSDSIISRTRFVVDDYFFFSDSRARNIWWRELLWKGSRLA
jgi:hypothetical protein